MILYFSIVIDTEATKIFTIVFCFLLAFFDWLFYYYIKIKDCICAKREKTMSDDEFEELKLQLKDELPWLYFRRSKYNYVVCIVKAYIDCFLLYLILYLSSLSSCSWK